MWKEYWFRAFEDCVEELMQEHDVSAEMAEEMLENILDKNCHYLDGYLCYE